MAQRKQVRRGPLSYGGYLRLEDLLQLQRPISVPPQRDELLFVIAHQTYELWFKLMLSELTTSIGAMERGDLRSAVSPLKRIVTVLSVLTQQLAVLETIRPDDFARFRDSLRPASGFQSLQFREIEFVSGQKDERFLELHESDPEAHEALSKRLEEPSLWDAFRVVLVSRQLLSKIPRTPNATRAEVEA